MAKLLVTGGAGFIGSHLVDRLVTLGHEVVVTDNLSTGKKENLNPAAKFIEVDIADYEKIAPHFAGVEAVFHCAALARIAPSVKDPLPSHAANVTGTLNVLWAAKNFGVKKLIYSGSSSAYGDQPTLPLKEDKPGGLNPKSPYALQKVFGEMYCKLFSILYGLDTVILRYFNVYGPRQLTEGAYATVIGIFLKQREQGKPMTVVGDAWDRRRDYTYISDVVEANILAWKKTISIDEMVINIGTNRNFSVREITERIGGPTIAIEKRPWEYQETKADNSKAKRLLGWEPKMRFEDGIAELKKLHHLQ
ncbi:MAG: NAD-dependent epimerase/dehydratase family protein [Candidatus Doudnabacteria bacterium]|nr:NAD-dependent epimerase/dehydratase family protein [Candidatus Doudnabacteria bacterium]